MKNKFATLILAGLMALSAQNRAMAFETELNLDIFTPISGGSGTYTIRIGTYQGFLDSANVTAFQQLTANFNTAYTISNLDGSAIDVLNPYHVVAQVIATSPYSAAAGYDNTVYYWITDTSNSTFALLRGIDTEWWDGAGLGSTDAFGVAGDSVTTLFGSMDTSEGVNLGAGAITTAGVAIPEPTSGSLFLLGAAGVLALRRLRKTNV